MKKLSFVLAAAFMITACTKKDSTGAPSTGVTSSSKLSNNELKIGISQEFENFNPLIQNMMATTYMSRMAIRTLSTINADGKWIPQLAKEIPSFENKKAVVKKVNGKDRVVAEWEILDNAS